MIHEKHTVVANLLVRHVEGDSRSPSLRAAILQAGTELDGSRGLKPPDRDPEDHEPGGSCKGWQHEAVEQDFGMFSDKGVGLLWKAHLQGSAGHKFIHPAT